MERFGAVWAQHSNYRQSHQVLQNIFLGRTDKISGAFDDRMIYFLQSMDRTYMIQLSLSVRTAVMPTRRGKRRPGNPDATRRECNETCIKPY